MLIPAFSLGRTQTIVFYLHQLIRAGKLRELPIFVDSPLAADVTEIFRLHPECLDDETARLLEDDPNLFGGKRIRYLRDAQESMELNGRREPCIIIAASGMCESGRILHHLKHNIEDARNTVLLVGYQAPDTLGQRLADHQSPVRSLDRMLQVRDRNDLLAMFRPLQGQTTRSACCTGSPMGRRRWQKPCGRSDSPTCPSPGETMSLA